MTSGDLGVGLPGDTPLAVVARVAALAEELGFASFWLNDTPAEDSLAGLGAAASTTERVRLGSGVIPLDRRPAAQIADDVRSRGLPEGRLVVGLGAGGLPRPVPIVSRETAALRSAVEASVIIGALGPRMRRLAATESDGVLLNWLTPSTAAEAAQAFHREASLAGRPGRTILYVRTAIDTDALPALEQQVALYGRIGAYAKNFDALGIAPADAAIAPSDDLSTRLGEYRAAVDEVVVRILTADTTERSYLDFVRRLADAV